MREAYIMDPENNEDPDCWLKPHVRDPISGDCILDQKALKAQEQKTKRRLECGQKFESFWLLFLPSEVVVVLCDSLSREPSYLV